MSQRARTVLRIGLFIFLFLLLNTLIGVYFWLPARSVRALLVPVPEAAMAAALVALYAGVLRRSSRLISLTLGFMLAVVFSFAVGEAFFQFVYREHFSMWRNLRFIPAFLQMVSGSAVLARPEVVVAVAALLLGLLATVFGTLVHGLSRVFAAGGRPAAVAVAGVLLLSGVVTAGAALPSRPAGLMLAAQLARGPGAAAAAGDGEAATGVRRPGAADPARQPPEQPSPDQPPADPAPGESAPDYAFPALQDEDVRLFIIESYGHTLFTRDDHYELIAPVYDRLGEELEATGFSTYSHFMKSPAFGGRSWLADATIVTGRWIGDQATYDTMWDNTDRTLVQIMEEAGYHTVLAAPGMTFLEEGFRELFPYDDIYLQGQLGYEGRRYSFGGGITDQFLLDRVRQFRREWEERGDGVLGPADRAVVSLPASGEPAGAPFFGVYVMVSSHVPFNVLPPFIEDWNRIGDGSIYNELPRRIFDNDWLRGGEYPEGYTASIEYSLRTVIDFLLTYVDDDSLAVVIGDHQPRIPIAERSSTFSVPIHVISRNAELVRRFAAYDFSEGLEPSQPLPHPGMDELQGMLLEAAAGGG